MRVLVMADVVPDPDAGASGTEIQTVGALRDLGVEVGTVWGDQLPRRIRHGNLHYLLELPGSYREAMLRRLRDRAYDVVHVNQPHGFAAARVLRRDYPRSVFVHRSHGFEGNVRRALAAFRRFAGGQPPWSKRMLQRVMARLLTRHERLIARAAHGHIVSASSCAEYLHGVLSVPAARVATIPQAAPLPYLSGTPPPMTSDRLRSVLYVGQYAFFKAPTIVAAVANRVLEQHEQLRMTWVAATKDHAAIAALLAPLVRPRVALVGWQGQRGLQEVYDSHGIFLFLSFFEGFGKALLEAMSRGLAVVASDVGGAHDIVQPGVHGLLVPAGSASAAADAVEALLADPRRAIAIARAAASRAREFTWERTARETLSFYERLLSMQRQAT